MGGLSIGRGVGYSLPSPSTGGGGSAGGGFDEVDEHELTGEPERDAPQVAQGERPPVVTCPTAAAVTARHHEQHRQLRPPQRQRGQGDDPCGQDIGIGVSGEGNDRPAEKHGQRIRRHPRHRNHTRPEPDGAFAEGRRRRGRPGRGGHDAKVRRRVIRRVGWARPSGSGCDGPRDASRSVASRGGRVARTGRRRGGPVRSQDRRSTPARDRIGTSG